MTTIPAPLTAEEMDELVALRLQRKTILAAQARIAELERQRDDLHKSNNRYLGRARKLREAMEFYANREIYKPHPHGLAFDDRDLSYHARAALKADLKEAAGS